MNVWRILSRALPALAMSELARATGEDPTRAGAFAFGEGLGLQLTLGLVVVLAAVVGLSWLLRRHTQPRGGAIQVLGGLPLGTRERLLLVEVDQVRLLIGVTATQIQALHVFPPSPPSASFQSALDVSSTELSHERPKS
ncbi:MAG: flagellar biosynthetic protein FliO [Candidatus Competibacteraceae bacterium]|nr:MAG: flagellar biosynthetic protein FliO [Candidatus Competibacteraceae bacterium]